MIDYTGNRIEIQAILDPAVTLNGRVVSDRIHGGSRLVQINLSGTTSTIEVDLLDFLVLSVRSR